MKEYKIMISISAECEDDMEEILEMYEEQHPLEKEWWCEIPEKPYEENDEDTELKEKEDFEKRIDKIRNSVEPDIRGYNC